MKRISLLGSTGSIGTSTLDVATHLGPEEIEVVGLAAHSNIDALEKQIHIHHPTLIAVYDKEKALELQKRLPSHTILGGMEGILAVATAPQADCVVSAITGTIGLLPTLEAIKAKKDVALANKESLVSGGALMMSLVKEKQVKLIPLDSEHSAIFQCLNGESIRDVHRIILTASGGPFRSYTLEQLSAVTVDQALNHPNWNMGAKVTIDSSTLMNKGLEVIEAHWLFGLPLEQIDVVVHPQSIIHSMVEFADYSLIAQMGLPDMRVPIQYALTYPRRKEGLLTPFDFTKYPTLEFLQPDKEQFRCLELAYEAVRIGGSLPCYMNAANEVLVHRFLNRQLGWQEIGQKLSLLMEQHAVQKVPSIEAILSIDAEAREKANHI